MKARPQELALFLPQNNLCPTPDEDTKTFSVSSAFTRPISRPHPKTLSFAMPVTNPFFYARTEMRALLPVRLPFLIQNPVSITHPNWGLGVFLTPYARSQMRAHMRRLAHNLSHLLSQQHTLERSHPQPPEHAHRLCPTPDEGTHTSLKSRPSSSTFALSTSTTSTPCPILDEGTCTFTSIPTLTILLSTTYSHMTPSPPSTTTTLCPKSDEGTAVCTSSISFTFSPPILDDETTPCAEYTLCPNRDEGTNSYTDSYTISSPKTRCPISDEGTRALSHTDSASETTVSPVTFSSPSSTTVTPPPLCFSCPIPDEGTSILAFTPAISSTYSHSYPIPFTPSGTPLKTVEKTVSIRQKCGERFKYLLNIVYLRGVEIW